MASQALYLKWRPQRFDDVVGQEHITQTLHNAIRLEHIGHAYLFTGPRGTGKTTMARLLAKAVNCLDADLNNRPCNRCHICTAINEGRLLDLIEMDAASNTGVDNVREAIREKVGFRPNEARYKVYVIDEVHMLSTSAFNALLKTLEEPPEHVIFILATTEPHKILPTIISRCQRFDFRRIPLSSMVHRLGYIAEQEGVQIEEGALRFIARISTGCARDAIGLLDQLTAYGDELITVERASQVLGLGDAQMVNELISHLGAHAIGHGLNAIHRAVEQGVDTRQFAQQVIDALRALLFLRAGDDTGLQEVDAQTQASLRALAQQFTTHDLVQAIKLFNQAQLDLRGSDQNQIALELAFVEAALSGAPPAVTAQPIYAAPVAAQTQPQPAPSRPAPASQTITPTPTSTRPAAPTKTAPQAAASEQPAGQSQHITPTAVKAAISTQELVQAWEQIKQHIGTESKSTASLINSVLSVDVQDDNCVVLRFAGARNRSGYNFNAEQLGKDKNKQTVERAISAVMGTPCYIRIQVIDESTPPAVREASPPFESGPVASTQQATPAGQPPQTRTTSETPAPDVRQQAMDDPVVQELLKRGGQIKSVEEIDE
ncbi:MAG: DNA polymerase III subunit gamma/tau [Anaerolineae bacterium]|nr:DNA polymerase III subunit gamma/tau [Anaerolineae bacterium]